MRWAEAGGAGSPPRSSATRVRRSRTSRAQPTSLGTLDQLGDQRHRGDDQRDPAQQVRTDPDEPRHRPPERAAARPASAPRAPPASGRMHRAEGDRHPEIVETEHEAQDEHFPDHDFWPVRRQPKPTRETQCRPASVMTACYPRPAAECTTSGNYPQFPHCYRPTPARGPEGADRQFSDDRSAISRAALRRPSAWSGQLRGYLWGV